MADDGVGVNKRIIMLLYEISRESALAEEEERELIVAAVAKFIIASGKSKGNFTT